MTKMKKTIPLVVVAGDARSGEMMRAFDVFEDFKVLAWPRRMHVEAEAESESDIDFGIIVDVVRKGLEERGNRVVAAFVPGRTAGAWRDPAVKVISNGQQWAMLDKMLHAYGWDGGAQEPCTT